VKTIASPKFTSIDISAGRRDNTLHMKESSRSTTSLLLT